MIGMRFEKPISDFSEIRSHIVGNIINNIISNNN